MYDLLFEIQNLGSQRMSVYRKVFTSHNMIERSKDNSARERSRQNRSFMSDAKYGNPHENSEQLPTKAICSLAVIPKSIFDKLIFCTVTNLTQH